MTQADGGRPEFATNDLDAKQTVSGAVNEMLAFEAHRPDLSVAIASAYFNVPGWRLIADELTRVGKGDPVALANVALWPVVVCGKLSVHHGLPSNLGTLEKPLYEGTPVFFFAFLVGLGLTWVFYSTVVFLILRLWHWGGPSTSWLAVVGGR